MRGWGAVDLGQPAKELGWPGPEPGPAWVADPEHPEWSLRSRRFLEGLASEIDFEKPNLDVVVVDRHMNEAEFADLMATTLESMLKGTWTKGEHHGQPRVIPFSKQGLELPQLAGVGG
jgi:hypothetical protein